MRLSVAGLTLPLLVVGCGGESGPKRRGGAVDAVVGLVASPDVVSQRHVRNLLRSHEIDVVFEGGLALQIKVPSDDAERASRLLRGEVGLRPFVSLGPEGDLEDEVPWSSTTGGVYEALVAASKEAGDSSLLIALRDREVLRLVDRGLRDVVAVRRREREFVDESGRRVPATSFELDLEDAGPPVATATARVTVSAGRVIR